MSKVSWILLLLFFLSCKKNKETENTNALYSCKVIGQQNTFSRIQLVQKFDNPILQRLASSTAPNSLGALSRNRNGYFHVRFQIGLSYIADYAIYSQQNTLLENTIKAIEYSFQYQNPNGNFQLIVPSGLPGPPPTLVDSASGVAFFLSSLGMTLNTLEQSNWYNSSNQSFYKNRIESLRPKIQSALNWLMANNTVLKIGDQNAPNRLFCDAVAFYSIGKFLNNSDAKRIGLEFAQLAIDTKKTNGYFDERNGWDSSYQGVSICLGFNFLSLLDDTERIKPSLWDCLSCATDWQKSRILTTGEISTEKNTRVYVGGEVFLGQEKTVDWIDTMLAFYMMSYYSNDSSYYTLAQKVLSYYN
jgi:hypothetical protein